MSGERLQSGERAREFLRGFARRRAPRVVPVPCGFGVLDDRYAASYDDNKLVVWHGEDPRAVLAAAEEVLGARGHRMVCVLDDRLGREFAPAFAAAGYRHEENVLMAYCGDPPRVPHAEELSLAVLLPVLRETWRETLPDAGDEVIEQLARRAETRLRGAGRVGFRGVRTSGGEIAARADLYVHDGVAQIEDLVTAVPHRGRGHARALMLSLLAEATAAAGLVFLVADAGDWPREFYARLGFAEIGRTHDFVRA
ncbi:GNAT family N-acetyltransferase [Nonomuraea sp. C10]|uniref:GNAT family N-acetyltransferase n=1 Tax=Nonomuraea sp. C10 TaxID=2600577 RepID=UPI0011CD7F12|nr:GNAT family N-acetyltransferase [Nonomuraea sp. C10]TXK41164.1 GNAT family N-acetyltransferase [Nonomuraea sp. C10]